MNFVPALLGAFVGGTFALLAGYLANLRSTRQATVDRVLLQAAELTSNAAMVANYVGQYQHLRAQQDQAETAARKQGDQKLLADLRSDAPQLNEEALNAHLLVVMRAVAELEWLTYRSPLRNFIVELKGDISKDLENWSNGYQVWLSHHGKLMSSIGLLDDAMRYVANLPPRQRSWYFESVNLPLPPPLGARIESTRLQDRTRRFADWSRRNRT